MKQREPALLVWQSVAVGLGRICGLWPWSLLCALIWLRVGVLAESIVLSPIQYRPCVLPPPTLMAASPLMSSVSGSKSGPWSSLAIEAYELIRLWMVLLLYASGGSCGLQLTSVVAFPLWARAHAFNWDIGRPGCAADCEKTTR